MDEKWLHEIDRKLSGHEATPPDGLWEGIERALKQHQTATGVMMSQTATSLPKRQAAGETEVWTGKPVRRMSLQGRWWAAAAAVLLLLVAGGSVLLTLSPQGEDTLPAVTSPMAASTASAGEGNTSASSSPAGETTDGVAPSARHSASLLARAEEFNPGETFPGEGEKKGQEVTPSDIMIEEPLSGAEVSPQAPADTPTAGEGNTTAAGREETAAVRRGHSKGIPFHSSSPTTQRSQGRHRGRPSFTLMASNMLGAGSSQPAGGQVVYGPTLSYGDAASLPMLFKNGYGSFNNQHIAHEGERVFEGKTRHHQPVRVGMTLSWPLTQRLSLETGLCYSYLSSDFSSGYESSYHQTHQRLQYLGLPLRFSYTLYSTSHWQFYASGGGMVEQCVAGRLSTERVDGGDAVTVHRESMREKRPQWSVQAAAGVHYGLTRTVGFYAEPGLGYYFDNHSPVVNIYKEHPLSFTLSLGLRLGF